MSVRWRCDDFAAFSSRCWEDEYFVFNPLTGHTHVLNASAWEVLRCCSADGLSEDELLQYLTQGLDSDSGIALAESLPGYLDQLRQLGLLQRKVFDADR